VTARTSRARFSARDRRALRFGLWLSAPALLNSFAVKPYIASIRSIENQLETQRGLLARERAILAAAPSVPQRIALERAAYRRTRTRMYSEPDAIAATGALSREVAAAFDDAGMSLQHVETRESTVRAHGVRELTIDIRGEGDFEGILRALASLEAGDRLIRISRITIEGGAIGNGRDANDDASGPQTLTVTATVCGYAR
jgi:hypothetical protein